MFASPSFDSSSTPQPAAAASSSVAAAETAGDVGSHGNNPNDTTGGSGDLETPPQQHQRPSPPLYYADFDDDDEDDNEEVIADVEEDEEEADGGDDDDEEDDDDDDEEDEDDDAVATPASGATTPAVTLNPNGSATTSNSMIIRARQELSLGPNFREIGKEALCWQLSSAKPGNGVEQIRDGSADTYWQSDGLKQPHWIQVHFARRVAVSHVCLYLDYNLDESYTPKRVSVHHGMTSQDLQAAVYPAHTEIEFSEPNGWVVIPLSAPPDPLDVYQENGAAVNNNDNETSTCGIRAHLLRISILSMHQNGRDTHIRQVELYGPRREKGPVMVMKPPTAAVMATSTDKENQNHATAIASDMDVELPREDDENDDLDWTRMQLSSTLGGVIR